MSNYSAKVHKDGPDALVVESGGYLDVESGGELRIDGTAVTASAAQLNALAGSFTDLELGSSGDAGSLTVYPATAANGTLVVTATNSGGARNLTLTNVAQTTGSGTLKLPDMASGTGQVVVTNADYPVTVAPGGAARTVTLAGNVTFSGAFNPTFAIPSSSTWTFPTGGGTLAVATGAETGTSALSFTVDNDCSTGQFALVNTAGGTAHTYSLVKPVSTQAVTMTLPDVAADTLVSKTSTDELTNKTLTAAVMKTGLTASGSAANDFSASTGTFKTSKGVVTVGNTTGAWTVTDGAWAVSAGNPAFDASASSGAFTTSAGTNTLSGNVVIAGSKTLTTGSGAVQLNGNTTITGSLTFATGTGAVSINGATTLATTKGVTFGSAAAGTATPLTMYSLTANKGGLIVAVADGATDHATTLTNSALNGAAATITLPAATCTLAGLDTADVLTNKSIDGDTNTLTDLGPKAAKAGVEGTRGAADAVAAVPFVLHFNMDNTAGTSTYTNDLDPARSLLVLDAWVVKTDGAGTAGDTVRVGGSGGNITDAKSLDGVADGAIARFASIDDATSTIAHDATLTVTTVADGDHCECEVNVLCMWV